MPTKLDTKAASRSPSTKAIPWRTWACSRWTSWACAPSLVISKAKANIKKNFGIDIDVDAIPFDDPEIFKLMQAGHTAGVFQIESAGMTATIKNMKPTEYKHVVALIALYRPGPLGAGMVSSYINRMNGKEPAVLLRSALGRHFG